MAESGPTRQRLRTLSILTSLALLPLARRANQTYLSLPTLETKLTRGTLPSLSIIVPIRDEAANLPPLLDDLTALEYPGVLEIIVVDDDSCDQGPALARQYGVHLLEAPPLPAGWTGKTHACHHGALAANGDWLLFVDADTRHHPLGPARAVNHALANNLHGLSLFLPNRCSGVNDRLALMVAFASFFASLPPGAPALNGQYILLQRRVYHRSGGFSAVRRQVTEDLALGRHLRNHGFFVPTLRGEGAGAVQMYRDASQLWLGLSRFSIASLRWSGLHSLWAVLFTILLAAPVQLLFGGLKKRRPAPALVSWIAAAAALLPWASRFGGRRWALLAPLGAVQVQFAAIWGIIRRLLGHGVHWKGRNL